MLLKDLVTEGPSRALAQWGPLVACGGAGVIPRASSYWSQTEDRGLAQSRPAAPGRARASQAHPNQPKQPTGRQPKFSRPPNAQDSYSSSQERRTASRIQRGERGQSGDRVPHKTSLECLQEMAAQSTLGRWQRNVTPLSQ